MRTCACADLSVSVGDPDPHSAPSPLHVAEQPPLAPLSVSPAVFSPTSSLENHCIFSSEHCPSNPDGSDLGSVSWQERDFQPFTLEETESPRGLGELPGLEPKTSVYKVLEPVASQRKILSPRGLWQSLESILVFTTCRGRGVVLVASSG